MLNCAKRYDNYRMLDNSNETNSDDKTRIIEPIVTEETSIGRDETISQPSMPLDYSQPSDNVFVLILRRLVSGILVSLCLVALMLSMATAWIKSNIATTETWTDKASRLIEDTAIRSSISSSLADQIFSRAVAEAVSTGQALPKTLPDGSTRDSIKRKVDTILQSQAFTKLWIDINRSAHQGLSNSLVNGGNADQATENKNVMYIDDGQLVFATRSVLSKIGPILTDGGFDIASNIDLTKVSERSSLMAINNLPTLMTFVDLFEMTAFYSPILFLTFLAGALAVSPKKRRTLLKIGWSIAFFVAPLAFLPEIVGYLSANGTGPVDPNIIQAFVAIFVDEIAQFSRVILAVALIIILACYANGTSRLAKYIRSFFGRVLHADNSDSAALGWIAKYSSYIIVAVASLAMILSIIQLNKGFIYYVIITATAATLTFVVTTIKQGATRPKL